MSSWRLPAFSLLAMLLPALAGCDQRPPPPAPPSGYASLEEAVAAGGPIHLQAGVYQLNETLVLSSDTALRGAGDGVTVLQFTGKGAAVIANADPEGGNADITLSGVEIDCNGKADMGAMMVRVDGLKVENASFTGCRKDGLRVSGKGRHTRGTFLTNLTAHNNGQDGIIVLWASREAMLNGIRVHHNRRNGLTIDHSEGSGVNIIADSNGHHGIFFRNLFGGAYTNVAASRNGRHGLYVQGMVASVGAAWRAQNNSMEKAGTYDEIFLSDDASLSYGVSRDTLISAVFAGGYAEFGQPQARYGIARQSEDVAIEFNGVIHGQTVSGDICQRPDNCVGNSVY